MSDIGLCACGCGRVTPVAKRTYTRFGHIKGQHLKYIHNHHRIGVRHTQVSKKKMSEALTGKKRSTPIRAPLSEETKRKIGEATLARHKAIGHPMLGRKLTEEHKKKISGENHGHWAGGRVTTPHGYILVLIGRDHPMSDRDGYVREHRYVMSEHLGRPLLKKEEVHHINGDRADNRLENLILVDKKTHGQWHASRVQQGEVEVVLQWHGEGMSAEEIKNRLHARRFEHLLER